MVKIWKNLVSNVKREKMVSLSNFAVLATSFVLLGVIIELVILSQTSLKYLEEQAQLTIFFKDDYSEQNILNLKQSIEKDGRVASVKYVSKQQAYENFIKMYADEQALVKNASPEILPANLGISAKNIADLRAIADQYGKVDGVEGIRFFRNVVDSFRLWSTIIYIVGFALIALFFMVSYSAVVITLRTVIHSRGSEFEIMKLVGASDNYVRKPLLYQGLLSGLGASLLGSALVMGIGTYLELSKFFQRGLSLGFVYGIYVQPIVVSIIISAVMIVSGLLLGWFGSYSAVKKYLK